MSRRDARRDDDERPRRDRDLFEGRNDRRRGGDGGRGARSDRDEFAIQMGGRDRKKSASPPPKKKEPTPDLTDTIPITERKRRLTQWDIKPPGYENVTAEQAKLSGSFIFSMHLCCREANDEKACSLCQGHPASNQWTQADCKPL